jgi:hypothetical protein
MTSMIFCSRLATGDTRRFNPKRNAGVYLESKTDLKKRALAWCCRVQSRTGTSLLHPTRFVTITRFSQPTITSKSRRSWGPVAGLEQEGGALG